MNRLARTDASPKTSVHFCTHCGAVTDDAPRRVCSACGLGVVLACAPGVLPRAGAAFLVVKSNLRISAASVAAEDMLGDVIGKPVLDVISGDPTLPRWIGR